MDERFTDRSRKAMELADRHARQLGHEYIGTEHILLGLIEENTGVAVNVLKNLGIDMNKVSREVRKIIRSGPRIESAGRLPQTPRAKKVIEYAIEECRTLGHNYVGTEHLLLGLLREQEGVAAQVLMNLGITLEDGRKEVLNLLGYALPDLTAGSDQGVARKAIEEPPSVPADIHQSLLHMLGPGHTDLLIRQAIQHCWRGTFDERRSVEEVEAQIRRLVERALRDFREDYRAFGRVRPIEPKSN